MNADTPDLPMIAEWLKQRADAAYNGARIAYAKHEDARAVGLYEDADTARRWLREITADLARQQQAGRSP